MRNFSRKQDYILHYEEKPRDGLIHRIYFIPTGDFALKSAESSSQGLLSLKLHFVKQPFFWLECEWLQMKIAQQSRNANGLLPNALNHLIDLILPGIELDRSGLVVRKYRKVI